MVVCYGIGNSKLVHISDIKQGLWNFLNRLRFIFNTANIFVFIKICLFNFSTNFNVHDHELSKLHDCTLWWHLTKAKSRLEIIILKSVTNHSIVLDILEVLNEYFYRVYHTFLWPYS